MNISTLISQIKQRYHTQAEYPWAKFPDYAVFRHQNNRKWFAVLMEVRADKIGIEGEEKIAILNVKANPEEIGSLRMIKGVYPAYHMNKEHWLSLHLAEIDEKLLFELLDESFSLTIKKAATRALI
ncbi:MmcQ/YjbR family DNA-binding protein [Rodentibacter trehalosifermentans]|uniref:MmcQ protein n=1 Tax=Rodentibacter trehalosifermentans TaxID=1908263 RepID=A0A1V3J438_9PAST|nr:MmcQ/YjbR family DNA-binding protein [Rodentibacter trehalosifermentans]OOF43691.1 MmcQ protein [Rodentibacter trehalosifermentans]OOF49760.1 MmcQ protein [Rodentibacter trehalosifermentans]OOF51631.1 MmcQ protein [Rodentibacter trehalosifermentans]